MKAADFAIRHPAIIGILLISLSLFGLLSFRGMDRDLLANITTPEILVLTVYPGASPEVVERDVTEVLEKEFSLIEGIDRISSNSHEGYSVVFVAMGWDVDLEAKKNDIRDRINNASAELPPGISGMPRLFEMGTSAIPVYTCLIDSSIPDDELATLLEEDIIPRFSRIADVSAVYARGVEEPAVRVTMDPARLDTMELTALEVFGALSRGQATVPAGDLTVGADRLTLQSSGDFDSIDQIGRQPVGYTPEGQPVYLNEVALVELGLEKPEFRASSGGERAVALDVMKRPGGDTNSVVLGINRLQEEISTEFGGSISFRPVVDDADSIGTTLSSVARSAWFGGVLAVLVLLLFLHDLRAALIVTLSIPFTVFLTFILMRARGMTLNMMTLAGITVSIGMIVDSSIVILENTMRHRKMGQGGADSASLGAAEVGPAVLASTSTSLSVFIPVLFVSGLAGAVLKEVSWVLVFSLGASAVTAIIIVPWLSSRILEGERRLNVLERFGGRFDRSFDRLAAAYSRVLSFLLDRKGYVLGAAALLVLASFGILGLLGGELFAPPDMNELEVTVRLPSGYSLEQSDRKMSEIAGIVRQEVPEIATDLWYAGLADSATIVDSGNPSSGYGRIRLVRTTERDRSVFDIVRHLEQVLPRLVTDAEFVVRNGGLAKLMNYATDGAGFRIEIAGSDWNQVLASAEQVSRLMAADPLVINTDIGIRLDRELMSLNINRSSAGRLAVDPVAAGQNLRILFNGEEAGVLKEGNTSLPIIVDSTLAGQAYQPGLLGRISVRNAGGQTVPYSAFASLERRESTDRIPHRDRLPSVVVVATLSENDLTGLQSRLLPQISATRFLPGITWRVVGVADVMGETFRELGRALAIAIFLVYAVMVIQFERFGQPVVIMGAVPFVLIGVALSLAAFGTRITMMTFFGVIALGGMVVNNAIVLVEFANQARKSGSGVREAVLEAARIRLKPILITTLTTLLGLVPLAFAVGEGSEIYAPLGQVIGGGLITSTLITLVIVPVLYELLEKRRKPSASGRTLPSSRGVSKSLILILAGGFLLTSVNPVVLGAAETGDGRLPAAPYDLEELTFLGLQDDPQLAAVREDARAAAEQLRAARSLRGPTLDLELGASYLSDPLISVPAGALGTLPPALGSTPMPAVDTDVIGQANDFRYDLAAILEQPLFTWGKISSGVKIAEAGTEAAGWQAAAREEEVRTGIRIICEYLALISKMKDATNRQRELGNRLSELTLSNFEEGFLLETEYRDTRTRLQQIILAASSFDRQEQDLLITLKGYTGLEDLSIDDLILPPVSDNLADYVDPDADAFVESAWKYNPNLLALGSLEDLAQAELRYAKGNAAIKPDLAFRTEFGYGGGFDRAPDDIDGNWTVTIGARSTLVDSGRSRAEIRSSEASARAAGARSEDGRRQLESFIRSSIFSMGLHRDNVRYFEILRDADAARARLRLESWDTGYGREEEWLLAELDRLASELQRLREVSSYIRLDREVRSAAGILNAAD